MALHNLEIENKSFFRLYFKEMIITSDLSFTFCYFFFNLLNLEKLKNFCTVFTYLVQLFDICPMSSLTIPQHVQQLFHKIFMNQEG